ncbi:MAG: hypothetical protein U1F59_07615 [Candidatus Competibacteraceae bacterium]
MGLDHSDAQGRFEDGVEGVPESGDGGGVEFIQDSVQRREGRLPGPDYFQ